MKFIISIILIICAISFAHAQTAGYFVLGDSTENVFAKNNEWVRIFLVDSTGTPDTVVAELYNEWTASWCPVVVRNDSTGADSVRMIPNISNHGNSFTMWIPYPGTFRLRRIDVANLSDKIYYYVVTRGK